MKGANGVGPKQGTGATRVRSLGPGPGRPWPAVLPGHLGQGLEPSSLAGSGNPTGPQAPRQDG